MMVGPMLAMFRMRFFRSAIIHLVILTTFISHAKKPKRNQKNERASLLGLTDEYSTFELPFKYSPNLIKIGKIKTHRNTAAGCCFCWSQQQSVQ